MNPPHPCTLEKLENDVVMTQLDDLCLVHFGSRPVDAEQTRQSGERLISFIGRRNCRKLVISFEGVENIYGFLLDHKVPRNSSWRHDEPRRTEATPVGSDLWVG